MKVYMKPEFYVIRGQARFYSKQELGPGVWKAPRNNQHGLILHLDQRPEGYRTIGLVKQSESRYTMYDPIRFPRQAVVSLGDVKKFIKEYKPKTTVVSYKKAELTKAYGQVLNAVAALPQEREALKKLWNQKIYGSS
jgi:hypothetical protein